MTPPRPDPLLDDLRRRYRALEAQPLRVVARLRPGAQLVHYDPTHLSGLLGAAVWKEHCGPLLLEPGQIRRVPVPLAVAWESPEGWPLYAATALWPVGEAVDDTYVLHKRQQHGRYTQGKRGRFSITSTAGRWMERRMPRPVKVASQLEAFCLGHAHEVLRLLEGIAFIGKNRAAGFGEVEAWEVHPAPGFAFVHGGRLACNFPAGAAGLLGGVAIEPPVRVAWTPPYHQPALHAPGWRAGTPVGESA